MISYEPLFRTMKEKKNVSTHTIDTLCDILDCSVSDVMEFRRETQPEQIIKE